MKIGIMTFWWSEDNYGQLLQCYALQKYLRDKGHDAFLIRYYRETDYIKSRLRIFMVFNPEKLCMYLQSRIKKVLTKIEQKKYSRNFDDFRNEHIISTDKIYKSYFELLKDPPEADVYIVGSDQVWNFQDAPLKKVKNLVNAYFLNFGNYSIKRMSYAASWGRSCIPQEYEEIITPLLKKFDYISVRERSGLEICQKMGVDAQWVPDPTMLLDKKIYQSLYKNSNFSKPTKPYLFFYSLGNKTEISKKHVYEWAKKRNLEVIYVTGNNNHDSYKKTYASIEQWLFLLSHAEYVITNSYHCAVFSTLFNKQYGVLSLKGRHVGMNTRFDSLWEIFELEERMLEKDNFELLDKTYNPKINKTLTEKFENFISK